MLFAKRFWAGMADGSITVAFRRWKTARARAGAAHRTPVGVLRIDEVGVMDTSQIGDSDVRRAGFADRAELMRSLRGDGPVYRVAFHLEGPDPREALRETRRAVRGRVGGAARPGWSGWTRPAGTGLGPRPCSS